MPAVLSAQTGTAEMAYPEGPLLRELAKRVLQNLDDIDARAPEWDPDSPRRNDPPYSDTQLLISTLGFLVFPHERTPGALGELLKQYEKQFKLADVITILHPKAGEAVHIAGGNDEDVAVDPGSIANLPRLLRNSIAHFNVRPIDVEGRFGGIRIWNENLEGDINLIADIHFDQLRHLARFILMAFAEGDGIQDIHDPPDPIDWLLIPKEVKMPKLPKINRDHWESALAAFGGDSSAAKTWIDRTISAGLRRLRD
jgi:hypothetical protein